MNPYLSLFYDALGEEGVPRGPDAKLDLRWLSAHRTTVLWLHAHWPEPLYHWHRGPTRLRPVLSWVKLGLFAIRLRIARLLGYRIVWTIHQVFPHDTTQPRLDRAGLRVLAGAAEVLLAHSESTVEAARRELGPGIASVTVIPHGSYIGVYPPGRARDLVRGGFGLSESDVMVLCFGELRGDSDIDVLLAGFAATELANLKLVFAGNVKVRAVAAAIEASADRDPRVMQLPGFVPFEAVAELYGAADVAVLPRGNGGTSGALILALSLAVPLIAADTAANRGLGVDNATGWLFEARDRASLTAALVEAATASPADRASKAGAASAVAQTLDWADAAGTVARRLSAAGG